jgi:hypothetical protein
LISRLVILKSIRGLYTSCVSTARFKPNMSDEPISENAILFSA